MISASDYLVVENCGIRTTSVRLIVLQVTDFLVAARHHVPYGIFSPAFIAIFKKATAVSTVILLLRYMRTMHAMLGLRPAPGTSLRPRFACVETSSRNKYEYLNLGYDPWSRCHGEESVNSFYADGTAYIFLCSSFFELLPRPTVSICPTVVENRFEGDQQDLHRRFQIHSLVYDLIRFYLGRNSLDSKSIPREVFDWNQCVFDLNEIESIVNPTNLELYIACMSHPKQQKEKYLEKDAVLM